MIIDFHTHAFPGSLGKKAIPKLEQSASIRAFTDGTVNGLMQSMRESNVALSIILPVVTNPVKADEINEFAAETNRCHDQVFSFGGIHPDTENYRDVLKRVQSLGLKGIKLHPEYQYTDFDDIRYLRIIDYAEELGLITVVHAGFDISFPDSRHSHTEKILNVLDKVNPQRMVLAHMGGYNMWEDVKKYIAGANVYLDTAFSFGKKQIAGLLDERSFIDLARVHGVKKILFATDSPWSEQKEMAEFVQNCALTEQEKEEILYKNASRLLNLS